MSNFRLLSGGAWFLLAGCLWACGSDWRPARNLVFISLDTTRRDHLTNYGYPRATAPTVDGLARRSTVFENVYAQSTHTSPSHATMFTGVYPHLHGVRFNGDRLDHSRVTLAQILLQGGFRTGAFISGYTLRSDASDLNRGFEVYDSHFDGLRRDGRLTTDLALEWLRRREPSDRYFLFLHLFDAHGPYRPAGHYAHLFESPDPGPLLDRIPPYQVNVNARGELVRNLNAYVDAYDAMIRYADDQIARLLDEVDFDDTVIVVTADHGETLGERYHKLDHGAQLFDEQIRIPLILWEPRGSPRRIEVAVETTDLLPTLLELLGVAIPADLGCQGRSLVPLLRGRQLSARPAVFSSADPEPHHGDRGYILDPKRRIHSVRSRSWKLILYPGLAEDYIELYDLENDPAERHNVANEFPEVRAGYLQMLMEWLGSSGDAPRQEIAPEVRDRLRELGYFQ